MNWYWRALLISSGLGVVNWMAPADLQAQASPGPASLRLGWSYNSDTEIGFGIDRATSLNGPWTTVVTVPAPETTFLDTGLLPATQYYYRVWAYNAAGDSDFSNIASVTTPASVAPFILGNPGSQTVAAGGGVNLSVVVSGAAPLTYQWYFNGTPLANQTASTLNLGTVRSSQGGNYSVVVSNSAGTAASSVAVLTVGTSHGSPNSTLASVATGGTAAGGTTAGETTTGGGGTRSTHGGAHGPGGTTSQVPVIGAATNSSLAGAPAGGGSGSGRSPHGGSSGPGGTTNSVAATNSAPANIVLQQPVINALCRDGSSAIVSFGCATGLVCALEYKNSLADPTWTPLGGAPTGTNRVASLTDSNAPGVSRFYRVRAAVPQ